MLLVLLLVFAADPPRAQLHWAATASSCEVGALRQAVEQRLGYDPFVERADTQVTVAVTGTSGVVKIFRADVAAAQRTFAPAADCRTLLDAMGLALAVAIDPLLMTRTQPGAPVAPRAESEPTRVTAPPVNPAPAVREVPTVVATPVVPWRIALLAMTGLELGTQPASLWGIRATVRVSRDHFGISLGPFLTFPSRAALDGGGSVDVTGAGADLAACVHFWPVSGCVASRVGAIRFDGRDLVSARRGWTPSAFIGPRVALEVPQTSAIAFSAAAELWFPLVRTRLVVGDSAAWEQPAIAGSLFMGVVWRGP